MSGMSAILDRPDRISAEAWGLARDFRRRVEHDDHAFLIITNDLFRTIKARQRKHPDRKLRAEMLADLARRWRGETPKHFRISYAASIKGPKGTISERRVAAETMMDDAWDGHERGCSVVDLTIVADKDGAHKAGGVLAVFSLHALARRFQRGEGTSDADLIRDMALVARYGSDDLPEGGGCKIFTDVHGGGWRGRVIRVKPPGGVERRVINVRTWLHE